MTYVQTYLFTFKPKKRDGWLWSRDPLRLPLVINGDLKVPNILLRLHVTHCIF